MSPDIEKLPSPSELAEIATEFESQDFTAEELLRIRATRRKTPRVDPAEPSPETRGLENQGDGLSP